MHRVRKPTRKRTPRGTDTGNREPGCRVGKAAGTRAHVEPCVEPKAQACTGAEASWMLAQRDSDFRPQKPGPQGPQGSLGSSTSPAPLANLDPDGTLVKGGHPAVHPAGGWGPCGRCSWTTDAVSIRDPSPGPAGSTHVATQELFPTWRVWVSRAAYLGRWPARRTHGGPVPGDRG